MAGKGRKHPTQPLSPGKNVQAPMPDPPGGSAERILSELPKTRIIARTKRQSPFDESFRFISVSSRSLGRGTRQIQLPHLTKRD
jgi:hypothetical protein